METASLEPLPLVHRGRMEELIDRQMKSPAECDQSYPGTTIVWIFVALVFWLLMLWIFW